MVSAKNLIKMARKWKRIAGIGRKRLSLQTTSGIISGITSTVADKGHFVAYTIDRKRFVFPIEYLNSYAFRELLILSEEEFGLPGNGPITFPCDSLFMEYVTKLIRQGTTEDLEKALLMSLDKYRCSLSCSFHQQETSHQLLTCVV